jgi:hypothetical protein
LKEESRWARNPKAITQSQAEGKRRVTLILERKKANTKTSSPQATTRTLHKVKEAKKRHNAK